MHKLSYQIMSRFVDQNLMNRCDERLQIFDIGSCDVNGSYRDLFLGQNNWKYCGYDVCSGKNVDRIMQSYWIPEMSDTADVVISGQTFEHVEFFWLLWKEMVRILKPRGLICLIVPSSGVVHRYPVDCWRFYKDSMYALAKLENISVVEADTVSYKSKKNHWRDTWAIFQKP